MFLKNDKRRLYWLIERYLSNNIDTNTFCNEFYECYDLELDSSSLTPYEVKTFSDLNKVVARFSPFEDDIKLYPNVYLDEVRLKQKVNEAAKNLKVID